MLEENQNKNNFTGMESEGAAMSSPQTPVEQASSAAQPKQAQTEPEDIFAETDHSSTQANLNEQHLGQQSMMASESAQAMPMSSSGSAMKKIIIVVIFILVISGIGYGMFAYYNKILGQRLEDSMKKSDQEQTIPVNGVTQQETSTDDSNTNTNSQNDATREDQDPTRSSDAERILEQQRLEEEAEKKRLEEEAAAQAAAEEAAIVDTDQDGLTDEEEKLYGTNPERLDTDADGLFDREEVMKYKTDPLDSDTDGDGFTDGSEVQNGYNPKGPGRIELELPPNN